MKCRMIARNTLVAGLMAALPAICLGAEDGAALFKAKCAGCHGASGEGKPAVKAPALKGTTLTVDQLIERITKGAATSKAPHNKGMAGLSDEQGKAIAEFIKTLK